MKHSYRRHRNPQGNEKKQKPFFQSTTVDKKKDDSFFQSKSEGIKINKADDKDEKEADTVAAKMINRSASNDTIQTGKKEGIQRLTLSTPKEDEKLGTAEQRMEKDKSIQEMSESKTEEKEEKESVISKQTNEPEEEVAKKSSEKEEEGLQAKSEMTNEEEDKETVTQAKKDIQKQEEQESEDMIQTKSDQENVYTNPRVTEVLKRSKGKGRPLYTPLRREMEAHFKCNFRNVKIHTDQNAIWMCKQLRAQAFTNGYDIYFNEGKFKPDSSTGKHLLTHELTHVVQQMYRQKK